MGLNFCSERFADVLTRFGIEPQPALFVELKRHYSAAGRFYHTSQHIEGCLQLLDRFKHLAQLPEEIELAIWFHDAIYEPRRNDNEQRSAELFLRLFQDLPLEKTAKHRIEGMILATKTHQCVDDDCALMLDIDLAILGQSPDRFAEYDLAIRREYAHIPDEQYRQGRRKVLQSFLARSQIYSTDELYQEFEQPARRNLQRCLAQLSS